MTSSHQADPSAAGPEAAWHARYLEQSRWTLDLRTRLLSQLGIQAGSCVLEVGSGTGVISRSLEERQGCSVVGLDIDPQAAFFASRFAPSPRLVIGDGMALPFIESTFDAVVCHFLLLWVRNPRQVVVEMARVTRPGTAIVAFAEPDYGGRIDFPDALARLGYLQADALSDAGADTKMGRKLRGLFSSVGLANVHSGVLGGEWASAPDPASLHSEWGTLEEDLRGQISARELADLRERNLAAWDRGERILFVPTFYALGYKP